MASRQSLTTAAQPDVRWDIGLPITANGNGIDVPLVEFMAIFNPAFPCAANPSDHPTEEYLDMFCRAGSLCETVISIDKTSLSARGRTGALCPFLGCNGKRFG